jgi:secreted trypsin-like serine protease
VNEALSWFLLAGYQQIMERGLFSNRITDPFQVLLLASSLSQVYGKGRIVCGQEVTSASKYPFVVFLVIIDPNAPPPKNNFICGGSILSKFAYLM